MPGPDGSDMTGMSLRSGYRHDQSRRGLSDRTIQERDKILGSFARHGELLAAGRDDIERWLDTLRLTPRSRSVYLSAVHGFYDWCVLEGHRADDPTVRIRRVRLPRLLPRPMADDDLALAISLATPQLAAWLALAAYQGFRCKEIAGLRREDVMDRTDPQVLRVSSGKGGHEAVLPLNPHVLDALRKHGLPAHGYVFTQRDGRPYLPKTVSVYASRYLREVGVDATLHQARHWFGTAVWKSSKDLRVTQELMRHSSPSTTAGYAAYDHAAATRVVVGLSV